MIVYENQYSANCYPCRERYKRTWETGWPSTLKNPDKAVTYSNNSY